MREAGREVVDTSPLGLLVGLRYALLGYQILYVSGGLVTNSCDGREEGESMKY